MPLPTDPRGFHPEAAADPCAPASGCDASQPPAAPPVAEPRASASGPDARPGNQPPTIPLLIREEQPGDWEAIRRINRAAFAGDFEARLVDDLRAGGYLIASLVAETHVGIVGHLLFSRLLVITEDGGFEIASLAPMAVLPDWQRRGAGTALVRRGLELCAQRGYAAAVVLGHPDYYARFGFSPGLAKKLRSPWAGPAWMARELLPGGAVNLEGEVHYPDAFFHPGC